MPDADQNHGHYEALTTVDLSRECKKRNEAKRETKVLFDSHETETKVLLIG
jgi:hypothetical protein